RKGITPSSFRHVNDPALSLMCVSIISIPPDPSPLSFGAHMTASLSRTLLTTAITGILAASAMQASAGLSSRFTDTNGVLVADAPTDESQWVDPDTLVFAYTPVEDPAVYAEVWA